MSSLARKSDDGDLSSWPVTKLDGGSAVSIAVSQYDPKVERQRIEIATLIKRLSRAPVNWSEREPVQIDAVTAETALAFIYRLPSDKALPKVAPDGDGGIAFIWENAGHRALIAIDRAALLLVRDPGTPQSHHYQPMPFDGETIPSIVIASLPRR